MKVPVEFPRDPHAEHGADSADEKRADELETEGFRSQPEGVTEDGGRNQDGEREHAARLGFSRELGKRGVCN